MTKKVINAQHKYKRNKVGLMDLIFVILLTLFALAIIIPFYTSIILSITDEGEYYRKRFVFWPDNVTWKSYERLFKQGVIITGYKNTLIRLNEEAGTDYELTASIGYAGYTGDLKDFQTAMSEADEALYKEKAARSGAR